jgi:hypothetical protein
MCARLLAVCARWGKAVGQEIAGLQVCREMRSRLGRVLVQAMPFPKREAIVRVSV